MPATQRKFKLGLLLDNKSISKYVFDFIQWAKAQEQIELSHVFVLDGDENEPRASKKTSRDYTIKAVPGLLFRTIVAIEMLFLVKNKRHSGHMRRFDLPELPERIVTLVPRDQAFNSELFDLDLLVIFAKEPHIDAKANLARLGAIFPSHSDDSLYRGGPAGFWEVYFREDVTGFAIRRWINNVDSSDVLLRGRTSTQFYYLLNQASLFEKSTYYLTRIVEKAALTDFLPEPDIPVPFCKTYHTFPRNGEALRYLVGLIKLTGTKLAQKLRGFDFRWHVAFVHDNWRTAVLSRAAVIENDPRHYLADPFVTRKNGSDYCFVEDYDETIKRAKITVYELGPHEARYIGIALEEPFHLSYPYLFEYQNELYMCPETSEIREIRIYKCIDFPLHWKLEKVIVRDISAVDTILFERDGRWWMLTNVDPADWGDFSLELHLFWADSPLDEQWTPHPLNPLTIDAARGRNGGMVKDGDRVLRVAQGQGFGMYGKRTSVNEIVALNEVQYVEKSVCLISPEFRKGINGTHHLHSNGRITVFDFADDGRVR